AIVAGGAGYQQTPTVTFTGGGGIGAKFVAEIDTIIGSPTFQQVIGFTKISGGAGYVSSPDVWIEGAPVPGTGVRKFVDGLPGLCGVT
ncbi:hypothetical protein, partial [Salmonella enterica]|uniref:hypothetical protein n=1 Tax=Salmonella enterica TaxID=28901 RepID=UPI0018C89982